MSIIETLVEAALRVLNTADPFEKARFGDQVASEWLQGIITCPYDPSMDLNVPHRPARLSNVSYPLFSPLLNSKCPFHGQNKSFFKSKQYRKCSIRIIY